MIFGTQYYRPPFPRKADWRRDLQQIKALNFNTVKLWAVWNWIEREPGRFDFSELDELAALCGELGLDVVINTIPEGAPYWTSKMEGSFYKTSTGETLHYSGPANIPSAGWPGLCPDSPEGLALICSFIEQTAAHFAGNKAVTTIDVWNEPHLEPMFDYSGGLLCYCGHSQEKFRQWLKKRYGGLEELNRAWFRAYTSWKQVEPPRRFGTAADMIDWRRFWLYDLQDWLRSRVAAARKGAPEKIIQTHTAFSGYMGANNLGGLGNELGDEFLLAKEVDCFGLSSFPLWLMGGRHVEGHFLNAEIIAEASAEKPFYQTELQGGAGKPGLLGHKVPSAADMRQWNWSVAAAGGKGVLYWQYAPEPAGMESPGFGLIHADGNLTPRAKSAAECAKKITASGISAARRVHSANAIFLSRNSDLFAYAMGDEESYNRSFAGVYRVLYEAGVPVRFAHADYIDTLWEQGTRILYAPMPLCLERGEREALMAFARQGGTLIVEGGAGLYRENGELDANAEFLQGLFGMKTVHVEPVEQLKADTGFSCMLYRQLFEACGADCEILSSFEDNRAAALAVAYGKGRAVWLSGFAGLSYHLRPDDDTKGFITGLFDKNGYIEVEELVTNGATVRLLEDDFAYYLVCVNRSDKHVEVRVKLQNAQEAGAILPAMDGLVLPLTKPAKTGGI